MNHGWKLNVYKSLSDVPDVFVAAGTDRCHSPHHLNSGDNSRKTLRYSFRSEAEVWTWPLSYISVPSS